MSTWESRHKGLRSVPNPCRLICLLLISILVSPGCGKSKGPPVGFVSGTVTLDGAPLKEGMINFIPIDETGAPSGAKIMDGYYKAEVPLGGKRVEIRSRKVVGQKVAYVGDPNSPKIDLYEERVPSQYNADSELKFTIVAGRNSAKFSLDSKKK